MEKYSSQALLVKRISTTSESMTPPAKKTQNGNGDSSLRHNKANGAEIVVATPTNEPIKTDFASQNSLNESKRAFYATRSPLR